MLLRCYLSGMGRVEFSIRKAWGQGWLWLGAWGLGRGVMPLVLLVATANSVLKALSETVPPEMETAGR